MKFWKQALLFDNSLWFTGICISIIRELWPAQELTFNSLIRLLKLYHLDGWILHLRSCIKLLDRIYNFGSLFCMHKSWRTWSVCVEKEVLEKETNCVDIVGSVKKSVNPFKQFFWALELNILLFEAFLLHTNTVTIKLKIVIPYLNLSMTCWQLWGPEIKFNIDFWYMLSAINKLLKWVWPYEMSWCILMRLIQD